jgi:hypothetical protein
LIVLGRASSKGWSNWLKACIPGRKRITEKSVILSAHL